MHIEYISTMNVRDPKVIVSTQRQHNVKNNISTQCKQMNEPDLVMFPKKKCRFW
jgi:hypothetical protein